MRWPNTAYLPTPGLVKELVQRRLYERVKRHEEQGFIQQWFLLHGSVDREALLNPQPARLRKLYPPKDRIWADPLLWKRGDDYFIFCEEWFYRRPYGQIAVMQLLPDGSATPTQTVLSKDHHLSYPFLFEHEGALHMVPEGGSGRAIEVYVCDEFPWRWRPKATLLRDVWNADATLLKHAGRWWLFTTLKHGAYGLNRDLFVFWADSPLTDRWTPHPRNPVVRGLESARPAGRIYESGGKLYRPSQNCLIRYGYALRINEIIQLDEKHYAERLVTEVTPNWEPGLRAVHHIDWHDGMLAMDAQRLLRADEVLRS
jgi:hypothetical protein